jgi:hypothetical protein
MRQTVPAHQRAWFIMTLSAHYMQAPSNFRWSRHRSVKTRPCSRWCPVENAAPALRNAEEDFRLHNCRSVLPVSRIPEMSGFSRKVTRIRKCQCAGSRRLPNRRSSVFMIAVASRIAAIYPKRKTAARIGPPPLIVQAIRLRPVRPWRQLLPACP